MRSQKAFQGGGKKQHLKDKMNELAMNSENMNIGDLHRIMNSREVTNLDVT
jgi:hypothetical protein